MTTLFGQEGADVLYGEGGQDLLTGGSGADILAGGTGEDTLFGGTGADRFYFGSALKGGDFVFDFNRTEGDLLALQASGFGLSAGLQLTAGVDFLYGPGVLPVAAAPSFYLDSGTNALWFDADGTGTGGASVVAFLAGSPTLMASDLVFV